jgi:hypothetical protein
VAVVGGVAAAAVLMFAIVPRRGGEPPVNAPLVQVPKPKLPDQKVITSPLPANEPPLVVSRSDTGASDLLRMASEVSPEGALDSPSWGRERLGTLLKRPEVEFVRLDLVDGADRTRLVEDIDRVVADFGLSERSYVHFRVETPESRGEALVLAADRSELDQVVGRVMDVATGQAKPTRVASSDPSVRGLLGLDPQVATVDLRRGIDASSLRAAQARITAIEVDDRDNPLRVPSPPRGVASLERSTSAGDAGGSRAHPGPPTTLIVWLPAS